MVNGTWKMENPNVQPLFSIYHLPFSIQAVVFQRPASARSPETVLVTYGSATEVETRGADAAAEMMVTVPLYVRVMGDAWSQLAEPIRRLHAAHSIVRAHGHLRIEHGNSVARFLARMLRLPRAAAAAETQLIVTARADGEHWQRTFDGRRLVTRQYASSESELAERFGLFEFRFRLDACSGSLLYVQRETALLFGPVRVRVPAQWAPRVEALEDPAGPTRVKLHVRIALPGGGLLMAYAGFIEVEDTRP
jgi:Domain of unknown function (DUF4166)